jgi:hypothetical protein
VASHALHPFASSCRRSCAPLPARRAPPSHFPQDSMLPPTTPLSPPRRRTCVGHPPTGLLSRVFATHLSWRCHSVCCFASAGCSRLPGSPVIGVSLAARDQHCWTCWPRRASTSARPAPHVCRKYTRALPGSTGSKERRRSERGSRNRGMVSRLAGQVELACCPVL